MSDSAGPEPGLPRVSSKRSNQPSKTPKAADQAVMSMAMNHDFLFQSVNPLRAAARSLESKKLFEGVVFCAILANVIAMAMEDVPAQLARQPSHINDVVALVDIVTLVLYTIEFLVRVFANGLMPLPRWAPSILQPDKKVAIKGSGNGKVVPIVSSDVQDQQPCDDVNVNSLDAAQGQYYFKSNWNRLDFLVLCMSFLTVFEGNNKALSSLRALRALRPLRMIHFIAPLQIIMKSIYFAFHTLVDTIICVCFMFLFFALFGQQLFQGNLQQQCGIPMGDDAIRFNVSSPHYEDAMKELASNPLATPTNYTLYTWQQTFCSYEWNPKSFVWCVLCPINHFQ